MLRTGALSATTTASGRVSAWIANTPSQASPASHASASLQKKGIHCEIIDPRTTSPLDEDTILESVENTGRLVVVDESNPRCSMASDIAGLVAQKAFGALKAPIEQVTAPHVPVPFTDALEDLYIPNAAAIEAAVTRVKEYR